MTLTRYFQLLIYQTLKGLKNVTFNDLYQILNVQFNTVEMNSEVNKTCYNHWKISQSNKFRMVFSNRLPTHIWESVDLIASFERRRDVFVCPWENCFNIESRLPSQEQSD